MSELSTTTFPDPFNMPLDTIDAIPWSISSYTRMVNWRFHKFRWYFSERQYGNCYLIPILIPFRSSNIGVCDQGYYDYQSYGSMTVPHIMSWVCGLRYCFWNWMQIRDSNIWHETSTWPGNGPTKKKVVAVWLNRISSMRRQTKQGWQ